MKLYRSFYAPVPEQDARQRATAFLVATGYDLADDSGGCLRFKRGSIIGTLSNFNPTKWACNARIWITAKANLSEIKAEFHITNDPFEKSFAVELLTGELNRLETAVTNNEIAPFDTGELRKKVAARVYRVIELLGGLILAGMLGTIAGTYLFNILNLSRVTTIAGGVGIFLILGVICLVVWWRGRKR